MSKNGIPWVDKYRPYRLKDIIDQSDTITVLKNIVKNGNLPHLLLYGPAGTGKTSTILSIAMELFGPNIFRDRILELNASDERGINVVREKITAFAKLSVGRVDKRYPCPPFKIIILDEADTMTTGAQTALRKVIEKYSNITRFCFICNYINQIIEPISSRCDKIRFKPINREMMINKLIKISEIEGITISPDALFLLYKISRGDMRKSITLLQNLKYLGNNINTHDVYTISNYISDEKVNNLMNSCINCNSIDELLIVYKDIKYIGLPIYNLLIEMNEYVANSDLFDDQMKSDICIYMSEVEKRIVDGSEESIQFLSVLAKINMIYTQSNGLS